MRIRKYNLRAIAHRLIEDADKDLFLALSEEIRLLHRMQSLKRLERSVDQWVGKRPPGPALRRPIKKLLVGFAVAAALSYLAPAHLVSFVGFKKNAELAKKYFSEPRPFGTRIV